MLTGCAVWRSATSDGTNGRQAIAPTTHAIHVTCAAGNARRAGFWSVTPPAYAVAAATHRAIPSGALPPGTGADDEAKAMIRVPRKAIAIPTLRRGGNPSPRNNPAKMAMRIGPMLVSIEAVPASTFCSAALSATL